MSKENLVKLLEAASTDEQLRQQLESADNFKEIKALAEQRGFDLGNLSIKEAMRLYKLAMGTTPGEGELSEGELDMVAGGGGKFTKSSGISFKVGALSPLRGPIGKTAGTETCQAACQECDTGCACGNY